MATVGSVIYVANEGSNTVSVIDTSNSNAILATISVGTEPYGVAYNSSSKEIYVANILSDNVSVIDADPASGTYNQVTNTITVGVRPFYITSIGTNMYVTNNQSGTVSVIATGSHTVTGTISVGNSPLGIKAIGNNLYVANSNTAGGYTGSGEGGSISIINTASSNSITDMVLVGAGPRGIAVTSNEVYVANFSDDTVSVMRTSDNTITNTIDVGDGPRGVQVVGTKVYVENFNSGTISVIDISNHTVVTTVKVGNAPSGMAAVGTDLYLTRFTDGVVSILDTTNNTLETPTTTFTFTGPTSGTVNTASTNFTITPDGYYTGTITITPSGAGSTGLSATVLTFSNSSTPQTFTITPTVTGSITLTPTNNRSLTNPSNVIYTSNVVATTLTAQSASSIGQTTATLNGTVTSTGGATVTTRGFNYGLTTGYGTVASESGSFSTGVYTQSLTGLTCGTLYNYQAFGTNASLLTGNSSNATFTTSACDVVVSSGGGGARRPASSVVSTPVVLPINNSATDPSSSNTGYTNNTYDLGTKTLVEVVGSKSKKIDSPVKELQRFLNDTYKLKITADGIFGKGTKALVKKWQAENGLKADGIVGPKTKALMLKSVR
jgi:YVTN family beta-propeller protein